MRTLHIFRTILPTKKSPKFKKKKKETHKQVFNTRLLAPSVLAWASHITMETVPPGTCHSKTFVAFRNIHVCQNDIDLFQIGDPSFEHGSKDCWKAECRMTFPTRGESPRKGNVVSPRGWRFPVLNAAGSPAHRRRKDAPKETITL